MLPAAAIGDSRLGNGGPLRVLAIIAWHRNARTGLAYPSVKRIARILGISRRAVQQHIRKLVETGYLIRTPRRRGENGDSGGCTSNTFEIRYFKINWE